MAPSSPSPRRRWRDSDAAYAAGLLCLALPVFVAVGLLAAHAALR